MAFFFVRPNDCVSALQFPLSYSVLNIRYAKTCAVLFIVMLNSANPYKANEKGFQDQSFWKLWDTGVTMQMVLLSKQQKISKK